ncbi:unnamed protein product [Ilex paraguariensis]|uniref:Uncharacterized protein n=1 Tax=Ilex paraguariensis TaxID=185542 RepID=A0ABC8T1S3_9AQUA
MVWCILLVLTSILSYFHLPLCTGEDSITSGKKITSNETITSAGGNFALGFFSPGNSTFTYLGIWYNTIPNQTVIWVANRESPLRKNSSAILTLGEDGNLVLLDGKREVVWSSSVALSDSGVKSTIGVLLDTGNLELRHGGGESTVLWESFEHPTDTLMPGMKLRLNRTTGQGSLVTSWADDDDPSPGIFSAGIDSEGRAQMFIWKQHHPYWRSNVYAGSSSSTVFAKSLGFSLYLTYSLEGDEIYITYGGSESLKKIRLVLTPSGQVELLLWQQSSSTWLVLWQVPETKCEFYAHCGPFGSCEQNGSHSLCKCLTGFEPNVPKEWVTGNWSGGCVRKKALKCDKGDGFLKLERMKLPDGSISLANMSVSECEFQCRSNCSCTAYAYANVSGEPTVNCLNWFGDLMDLTHNYITGQDLYVHLHVSEIGGRKNNSSNKARILIAVAAALSIGLLLIIVFGYVLWFKRLRRQERTFGNIVGVSTRSVTTTTSSQAAGSCSNNDMTISTPRPR